MITPEREKELEEQMYHGNWFESWWARTQQHFGSSPIISTIGAVVGLIIIYLLLTGQITDPTK